MWRPCSCLTIDDDDGSPTDSPPSCTDLWAIGFDVLDAVEKIPSFGDNCFARVYYNECPSVLAEDMVVDFAIPGPTVPNPYRFYYSYNESASPENRYEFPTLQRLHTYCVASMLDGDTDNLVFYAHSKCATHDDEPCRAWRRYMSYFVFDRASECIEALTSGDYDTCGPNWLFRPDYFPWHYSGNFWWARCDYVARLVPPELMQVEGRLNAEFWIGSHPDVRPFCQHHPPPEDQRAMLFQSPPYQPEEYVSDPTGTGCQEYQDHWSSSSVLKNGPRRGRDNRRYWSLFSRHRSDGDDEDDTRQMEARARLICRDNQAACGNWDLQAGTIYPDDASIPEPRSYRSELYL